MATSTPARGPLLASLASLQADLSRLECRRRPDDDHQAKRPKFEQPPKLALVGAVDELQLELSRAWLPLLFGVDTKPYEGRGEASARPAGPPMDARSTVGLTPSLKTKLQAFDARVKEVYLPTVGAAVEWKPLVREAGAAGAAVVVVKALLAPAAASKRAATQFKVRHGDGTTTKGQAWGYLEPLLKQYGEFRQGFCRAAVHPQLWSMNGQAGVTLVATQMALWRPTTTGPQLDIDALYPDEELLRDELEA